ncbi:hypothetical protein MTO96_010904 [Rhipicephalus appendiculatus]
MLALLFFVIATLTAPYARSLSLGADLRFEEDTEGPASTFRETVSSEDEEYVPPPSDCDDSLVCLASSACGCPDITPVLLYEEDSFTCVAPRRLSESCQSDAECRYGDDHAQCVESSCTCQSLFYDPGDGSRCLPVLGYQRLHKHRDDKSRQARDVSHAIESSSRSGGEWFSARLECTTGENGDRATGAVSSWMHAVATKSALCQATLAMAVASSARSFIRGARQSIYDRPCLILEPLFHTVQYSVSGEPHSPAFNRRSNHVCRRASFLKWG